MANKNKKTQMVFGENLTAYEVAEALGALNTFLEELADGVPAHIDASATQTIDTAGCQLHPRG